MKKLTYNESMALDKFLSRYPTGNSFNEVLAMVENKEKHQGFAIQVWGEYQHLERVVVIDLIRDLENYASELDNDSGVEQ